MNKKISLIGVPTDVGAGHRGSSMGPEALRVAGITQMLEGMGLEVHDMGNLHGPANPFTKAVNGYRHLDEVVQWNQLAHDAIYAELKRGHMPIMLGGDHCLGAGSISAVARYCREQNKELRIIWLDAHTDFNTAEITPSGNMHGMPVACLYGHGPKALVEVMFPH
jgi:arginase